MKTEVKIHKVGDCYELSENGFTRHLTGDFTIEMVGAETVIQFNGEEPNPFDSWVACSDRLPEDGETVIIWDGDDSTHSVFKGGKFYQDISWCSTMKPWGKIDNEIDEEWITHWRPLPPPPMKKDPE